MNRRAIQLVLVAALVAIAGCAGGMGGDPGTDATTDDSSMMDSSDGTGTAAFYVSDEPNAIDDFEHLNVTITKVGFKKTGSVTADATNEKDGEANETDGETNETDGELESDSESELNNETESESETDGKESEADETDGDGDGASDEHWIERDVNETTVDLTELKGANASMIDEFELPAGEYETVFIYVSDTEGVLTDGTETRVKLPSEKLQLHTTFTIGNNESVDFVYDIAPHKTGKSGKYILKPVISESGTGDKVEIQDIDKQKDESEAERENEQGQQSGEEPPQKN
ncbi:DUF4382 domain-containing protein [Haloarchaeobius amylolyticus]|uniref:DUF4382 domain-containing protein n=1 Tax=Haloarchaeobius amylolyticus TaxID=1198296 RepID=A0ABD6BJI9_9EURY